MIDKLKQLFIGSIDGEGFPTIKANVATQKRKGIKTIYLTTNTSSMRARAWRNTVRTTMRVSTSVIRDFLEVSCHAVRWMSTDSASKEMIFRGRYHVLSGGNGVIPDSVLKFTVLFQDVSIVILNRKILWSNKVQDGVI